VVYVPRVGGIEIDSKRAPSQWARDRITAVNCFSANDPSCEH